MTTLYKVLGPDCEPVNGGTGQWHRPSGKRPGKWMPEIPDPVACRRGYHLVSVDQLLDWLGPRVWVAEFHPDATVVDDGTKLVGSQARLVRATAWGDRVARHFAADCAESVLPIFERAHPGDDRPRKAVEAARLFAEGMISRSELAAAWDAAWDAARVLGVIETAAAARAAAQAAARAAAQAAAQEDAARAAAWAAAQAAARAAARAAAQDAERRWQTDRLLTYLHPEGDR